jgi:hypothetical protein
MRKHHRERTGEVLGKLNATQLARVAAIEGCAVAAAGLRGAEDPDAFIRAREIGAAAAALGQRDPKAAQYYQSLVRDAGAVRLDAMTQAPLAASFALLATLAREAAHARCEARELLGLFRECVREFTDAAHVGGATLDALETLGDLDGAIHKVSQRADARMSDLLRLADESASRAASIREPIIARLAELSTRLGLDEIVPTEIVELLREAAALSTSERIATE